MLVPLSWLKDYVDIDVPLAELAERLGWPDLVFQTSRIAEYEPDAPPDLVLALHACDTATDEALAQGVRWQAETILSVPCCHHHLQAQLGRQPALFAPVYRHGILKERLGDVLTDALRARVLFQSPHQLPVQAAPVDGFP